MTLAGPFRFMGLIGISAYKAVIQDLLVELSCETKVPPLMQKVVGSGAMGVAKAEGFYDYTPERAKRWEEVFLKLVMKFARSRKGIPKMSVIKGRRTMEFTYNQASRREFIGSALAAGASAARLRGASVIPLAPTPQMGWMSWNQFGQDVSEELVRETADILVNSGMKTLGYRYLDSTITGRAAATARSIPIRNAFPRESRLLPIMCTPSVYGWASMLGIYSDAAGNTCEGQPGSFGNEERDAKTFASRGIDYLKYDYCHVPEDQETAIRRYSTMSAALRNTGRPIVFSICEWGPRQPWLWGGKAGGQLWRTTWDIRDIWKGSFDDTACGILGIARLSVESSGSRVTHSTMPSCV